MAPEIFRPVKPWIQTQEWGRYNDVYKQFGFSRHNGTDVLPSYPTNRISAPFDCTVTKLGYYPNGAGRFVQFLSKNLYKFPDLPMQCQILVEAMHCEKLLVSEGQEVKCGEQIAIADNTGFSTGPHTHFQFRRGLWDGISFTTLDQNEANNSFDPTPYFSNIFAEDYLAATKKIATLATILANLFATFKRS